MARYDPDRLARDIGRRVAELRRERGLTQQALAGKLRATMQWVQQIEYGANLTVHSLARVANALDVDIGTLFVPPNAASYVMRAGRPPGKTEVMRSGGPQTLVAPRPVRGEKRKARPAKR